MDLGKNDESYLDYWECQENGKGGEVRKVGSN